MAFNEEDKTWMDYCTHNGARFRIIVSADGIVRVWDNAIKKYGHRFKSELREFTVQLLNYCGCRADFE